MFTVLTVAKALSLSFGLSFISAVPSVSGVCLRVHMDLFISSVAFTLHFVCDCYYEAINFNKRRKSREANSLPSSRESSRD